MARIDDALAAWGNHDRDNPFPLFAALRERAPVLEVTLADGHAAWLVVRYEEARSALSDDRLSKDLQAALATSDAVVAEGLPGPAFARHMLVVDPPDHTRLRRLVSAAFSVRRIESLRPQRVEAVVDDLLDGVSASGPERPVDLVVSFAFPLPFTVICELLGVPEPDRRALGDGLQSLVGPTSTDAEYARAKVASDAVVQMLEDLVDTKQREPADDLVSALITARDGDARLDQRELLSTILQLIIAGHDTTTTLIGNSVVALLQHPDQLAAVRADPSRMHSVIEELLRYDAPVPHSTFRYAVEPIELGGVTIPAGAQVIINLASASHDEQHYERPEKLDIDRPEVRHLAFGHGIHFCLGAPLARMEGQLALNALIHRFPELRLAVPAEELHWGHGDGLVLRGLSALPVVPGREAENRRVTGTTRADVVIVGGGLLGLSTAWALRGEREVLVLEREAVGHARGGSHGATRIFRLGYADAHFVAMAQRAAERWRALETDAGVQLLFPTPQLTFGPGADAVFAALTAAGAPVDRLTAADVEHRFPAFGGRGGAVLEPASAVIAADQTLTALRSVAGATVREHVRVERLDAHRVVTASDTFEADAVIVCAGPWTPALVPGVETTASLEHVAYVRAGSDLPIFIDFTQPAVYGLPTPGSDLYKIAVHHGGPTVDPDAAFAPDPAAVDVLRQAIDRWLPQAELVEIDVCPYDNTADERFVIERRDGIVVGAGTSGHGFKFGPLLGEQLAQLVRDRP